MYSKYKLIKWSHIHDFVTSITMILVFGFTVSTVDFSGQFTEVFDISHEAKGVYLVQLIVGDKQTSKVVLHN